LGYNLVYASTFRPGAIYKPGFHKFVGTYQMLLEVQFSEEIGPSVKWNNATYDVDATGQPENIMFIYLERIRIPVFGIHCLTMCHQIIL